jgi:hypothetical protein
LPIGTHEAPEFSRRLPHSNRLTVEINYEDLLNLTIFATQGRDPSSVQRRQGTTQPEDASTDPAESAL